MCGENLLTKLVFTVAPGSPPRVRGKLLHGVGHFLRDRITPACAGKTDVHAVAMRHDGDHPRVCGENTAPAYAAPSVTGSPPRVRGKRIHFVESRDKLGITPACAGKTSFCVPFDAIIQDHPRVCGENLAPFLSSRFLPGSPPRVRGKRKNISFISTCVGITPACAGKTCARALAIACARDHPRVCGENKIAGGLYRYDEGSPPRVRGKQEGAVNSAFSIGITPACAGKTGSGPCARCRNRDHPRVCGENVYQKLLAARTKGSPPRVRGKPKNLMGDAYDKRITPACAGKTAGKAGNHTPPQDHPRVCGENYNQKQLPI